MLCRFSRKYGQFAHIPCLWMTVVGLTPVILSCFTGVFGHLSDFLAKYIARGVSYCKFLSSVWCHILANWCCQSMHIDTGFSINSLKPSKIFTIIGSNNSLSSVRRKAIIWGNAGLLLIWPLGTNFNEIWTEIPIFSFKKVQLAHRLQYVKYTT